MDHLHCDAMELSRIIWEISNLIETIYWLKDKCVALALLIVHLGKLLDN